MYLTQNAQILAEEFKNHEKYNEKNILKKISGVSANQVNKKLSFLNVITLTQFKKSATREYKFFHLLIHLF